MAPDPAKGSHLVLREGLLRQHTLCTTCHAPRAAVTHALALSTIHHCCSVRFYHAMTAVQTSWRVTARSWPGDDTSVQRVPRYPICLVNWFMSK